MAFLRDCGLIYSFIYSCNRGLVWEASATLYLPKGFLRRKDSVFF